ncbi:ABC transporter permease [Mycobacterium sp. ACS4331]|uniref:ABC transporter permease n=1 Tax=Mycobacterium sp. ACS4331 TaxID=1834121 RepID=UPI001E442EA3|nr:ABC transporter permease [Mycobacterium sp. ACS4331]
MRDRLRMPLGLAVLLGLTLVFLDLPLLVIVLFSFNSSKSLSDLAGFSLRWYEQAFGNPEVMSALGLSVLVASSATVIAVCLGTALSYAFVHGSRCVTRPIEAVTLSTLITPELATAVGLMTLFVTLQIPLSTATLIAGHATFTLVYVTLLVGNRLRTLDPRLEEAAADLGAGRVRVFVSIVVPQLRSAVAGAAALAFVLSFGDFVTSVFLSGTEVAPLPVRIYGMLRFGLTPEINAVGTTMVGITVALGLIGIYLQRTRVSASSNPNPVRSSR